MNAELVSIPGLASLATRRLARGDFEVFRLEWSEATYNGRGAIHTGRRTGPFTVRPLD